MLPITYRRILLSVSMIISLLLFASPASAMCFYNKMNPSDIAPEGYNLSQDDKTVVFNFKRNGAHLTYSKSVGINQHQCIGGDSASVYIYPLDFWFDYKILHVDTHGYVVVETEPSNSSTASKKYFKVKMSVYSQSNALQNSFTQNLGCSVRVPNGFFDGRGLDCWNI